MKTLQWLKNSKGEFEQVGSISEKVKWVYIELLDAAGNWKRIGGNERKSQEAFQIITGAIEKKQTGKTEGYRMVPVTREPKEEKKEKKKVKEDEPKTVSVRTVTCTECGSEFRSNDPKASVCVKCSIKKGEEEMAKSEKKNGAAASSSKDEKLLGIYRPGTGMYDFVKTLLDEKPHKLSTLLERIKKDWKVNPELRLSVFKQNCKQHDLGGVLVDRDADTIQFKKGKGQHSASAKKSAPAPKASKKHTNGNGNADQEPNEVATLVRKAMSKSGAGDWTRNKLIEKIHAAHQIEPKRITAAIVAEIKAGGITEKNGMLSLSGN